MAWSAPPTQVTGTLITASIWNRDVVANPLYLFSRPYASYMSDEGDYTTTSTSFTPIDTSFAFPVTFAGTRAKGKFTGVVAYGAVSQGIAFDVEVDGTSISGGEGVAGARCGSASFADIHHGVTFDVTFPVTAGARTVRPVWRTSTSTATLKGGSGGIMGVRPQFWVEEAGDA